MPKVLEFGSYVLFFWAAEDGEPVHVHVAVRRPTEGATKIWLTRDGGCVLAHNAGHIPPKDLRTILELVAANHGLICRAWREHFGVEPRFYC